MYTITINQQLKNQIKQRRQAIKDIKMKFLKSVHFIQKRQEIKTIWSKIEQIWYDSFHMKYLKYR